MENLTPLAPVCNRFQKEPIPAPTLRAAVPALRRFNTVDMYKACMIELRLLIETEYGTVRRFCDVHNIDRYNMSKCFRADDNDTGKEMSVGLYFRCMVALGSLTPCEIGIETEEDEKEVYGATMSLRLTMKLNHTALMKSAAMLLFN